MTVSTVGVTKKRVRVIEQKTNHSIEYENDVYVVDTADPTLVLQTGSSSGVDLTGSNTLSSQADSTTTIASGANSTATIGSGNLSTVNIGTGTNSATYLKSTTIRMGSDAGNHNIYVGSYNAPSGDAIKIGDAPSTYVTVGTVAQYANSNTTSFSVLSKDVQIGQTLDTNSLNARDTNLNLYGGQVRSRATGDYEVAALGNIKLVSNDAGLNETGTRTYLSMISGAATLAHVDSSNTIQANCSLSSGTATVFGLTESKLDSDTSAVVESPDTTITGTTSLVCSSPSISLVGSTEATVTSPSSSIKHVVTKTNPGNFGDTAYSISGVNAFTSQGVSNFNKGTVTLKAAQVTTNGANTQINGYTLASQITMSPSSESNNIHARSASGILLRSNDIQLNNVLSTNQSGYYAELNGKAELRCINSSNQTVSSVTVQSTSTTIGGTSTNYLSVNSAEDSTTSVSGAFTGGVQIDCCNGTSSLSLDSTYNNIHSPSKITYVTYGSSAGTADNSIGSTHSRVYTGPSTVVFYGKDAGGNIFKAGFYGSRQFKSEQGFDAQGGGYTPFTGVHMFDVQPDSNISIGDAVIAVNHTAMLTTTPNDKRVAGIVCEILENNRISVASVGDNECGQLKGFKVCNENGTISAGDLLTTSSTAGYLMKQSDDIMRSSTVGKSAVDVVFDNNNLAVDVYGFIYCG